VELADIVIPTNYWPFSFVAQLFEDHALSLASAEAQGNVVRAICISKGKAHF
jgi:hypothetical protein